MANETAVLRGYCANLRLALAKCLRVFKIEANAGRYPRCLLEGGEIGGGFQFIHDVLDAYPEAAVDAEPAPEPLTRLMRGPSDAHPNSEHYGEHPETPFYSHGPFHVQCTPVDVAAPEPQPKRMKAARACTASGVNADACYHTAGEHNKDSGCKNHGCEPVDAPADNVYGMPGRARPGGALSELRAGEHLQGHAGCAGVSGTDINRVAETVLTIQTV